MNACVQFPSSEGVSLMDINITKGSEHIVADRFGGEVYYDERTLIIIVDSEETAWDLMMSKRVEFDQED